MNLLAGSEAAVRVPGFRVGRRLRIFVALAVDASSRRVRLVAVPPIRIPVAG
jgi:hypothetical protein